jgi:MFS family permease
MTASVAGSLCVFLTGALAVQIRAALHFGTAALGVAISIYYLGAAIGSIPLGRLVEAVGGVRVMRWACLASALVLILIAAPLGSFAALAPLLFAGGVVSAAMQPATNLFLARRLPAGRQGLAFGLKQSAVPASALLGGLAVPALALTVGWRWAFVGGSVLAVVAYWVVPRPATTLAERRARPPAAAPPTALRPLVVLTVGFGLGVFTASSLSAFTVASAVDDGVSKAAAGLLAALGAGVAVVVRIAVGARADRRGQGHLPVVGAMLAAGALGYGLLASVTGHAPVILFAAGIVVAYGAGWGWNGLFNFAVVRTHPAAAARATSITQVGGRLAGAIGPLAFGLLTAASSYRLAWSLDGAVALIAGAVIVYGRHLLLREREREAAAARPVAR